MEPPRPSSSDTLVLPPRIRPQVGGTGLGTLPRWKDKKKKPLPYCTLLLPLAMWGLGKQPSNFPVSAEKEEAAHV